MNMGKSYHREGAKDAKKGRKELLFFSFPLRTLRAFAVRVFVTTFFQP